MKQGVATVADAWRPTSELERRLHESVRAGDQEGYFRVLADSELVVPVPPDAVDDVLANEAQPTWPTREEDGRVHVLTYTSAAAMRACLGPAYRHFMTVRFGDIAQSWPDAGWWLAVDAPGNDVTDIALPIEARLPSWFVRQVAEGDGRPPRVGRPGAGGADGPWEELRGQHRELPRETRRPEFQPANDVERELLRAAANNDHDLFLQTLAGTEVLLPVPEDTDYALRPGRPGFPWQTRDVDGATVVPVFTSPERLIEAARAAGTGTEYIRLPFTVALRYWPHPDWQLAINSGSPAGGTVQAQQLPGLATWADQRAAQRMTDGFEPQNDVEQRLFDAARRRDTDTFYKVLLGAQVLVPADPDTPWGITPDDSGFPWHPVDIHGRPSIQVFTSLKWMNDALNSSRFVMPTLLDMVAAWPDASWTFVLNPGTPIDASMPGDKMRGLAGPPRAVPEDPATRPSAATPPPPDAPAVPVSPPVPAADGPVDAHTSAEPPLPGDTAEATSMHGAEAAGVRGETGLPSGNLPPAAAGHGAGMPDAPASPSEDGRTGPRGRDDQAPDAPTDTPPPAPLTNAPGADLASGPLPPASLGAGHAAPNHGAGTPGADETTGLPSGPLPPDTTAAGPSDRAPDATTGSTPADPLTNEAPGARGETTPDAHTPTGLSNEPLPPAPLAAGNSAPNPGEDPNTRGDGTPGTDETTGLPSGPLPPDTAAAGPSNRTPDTAMRPEPADPLTNEARGEVAPTGLTGGPLVGAHGDTGPQAGSAMPGAFVDGPGGRGEGAPSGGPFDPLSGVGATDAPSAGGEAPSAAHGPHPGAAADDTGARDLAARPVGASFSSTTSGDAPSPRGEGTLGAAPSVPLTADGRTGPDATDASVDGPGTRGEGTPSAGPSTDVPDTHGETLPTQASTNLPDGSPGASVDGPGGEGTSSAEPSVPPALGGYADLGATGDPSVRGEPAWPGAGPADAPGEWAPRTGTAPSDPLAADHLNPRGEGATGAERPVGEPAWPGAEATNAPGAPASPDPAAIDDRERAGEHGHLSPGPGDDAGVPAADEPRRLAAYGSPSEPEGAEHDRPGAAGVPDGGDPTRTAIDSLGTRVAPTRSGADPEGGEHPPEDAGGHGLRAVPEAEPVFEPGNRIDQELYEATLTGDSDAFLRVLLNANVLVPIPDGAPLEATPVQRDFRWDAALRDDSSVRVFTSLVRLREVLPEARFVYADFRELIGVWPRADWAMLLNPGTRIGASLRGEQVQALSEWAVRVGLVQARPEVPLPPPRQPEPEPVVRQEPRPVADPDDRVSQLAIMQKVVPHGHVGWYLEQGYDRIGGFVHLTSDVAELQTPAQLYEALGLLYDDSPFSPADEGVYVIRWPAYCPDIYRVPFGGQSEDEMAAWGESGWVVERPPFVGSGFAPGSAGSIREFKVDSVRLPYGSEMYLLGTDRSERFVAMYDPDRLGWLRPEPDGRTEAAQ